MICYQEDFVAWFDVVVLNFGTVGPLRRFLRQRERFIAKSASWNIFKIGECLAKLQQERGCLMHLVRIATMHC